MESGTQQSNQHRVYGGILLMLLLLLLFSTRTFYLFFGFSITRHYIQAVYLSRFLYWLCLVILFIYSIKIERQKFLVWEEIRYTPLSNLLAVIALFAAQFGCSLVTVIIVRLMRMDAVSQKLLQMIEIFRSHPFLIVFTCITAGVVEELIIRGYLQPRLEIIFKNPVVAILISAAVFGALHFGYATVANVLGPFLFGILFGYYYWRYRSIKTLIICHTLWDLFSISLQLRLHH